MLCFVKGRIGKLKVEQIKFIINYTSLPKFSQVAATENIVADYAVQPACQVIRDICIKILVNQNKIWYNLYTSVCQIRR